MEDDENDETLFQVSQEVNTLREENRVLKESMEKLTKKYVLQNLRRNII